MQGYTGVLTEFLRDSLNGKPRHWFDGPDCVFCGCFGPTDEDEPCEPIFTLHQVKEIINVAQRLAFREKVVGETELIIKTMRENLEQDSGKTQG